MYLLNLITSVKIDFTKGLVEPDSGSFLGHEFEITPKEFLNYSKKDFKSGDKRGNVNALTNAKRAIDCQVDKLFYSIGVDPNNFPKVIEDFVSKSQDSPIKKDLPIRLKFLQAMRFAPAEIIANARTLRHKLEHYYKDPSNEEVSNAIELAELFISATDSKLKSVWDFTITDEIKYVHNRGRLWDCLYVRYTSREQCFSVTAYIGKEHEENIVIESTSIEFYYLLKIATSLDYETEIQDTLIDLLETIGHPLPKQHISIQII